MCEVWSPRALADGPHVRRGRLEAVVDTHVASRVELDAGLLEADPDRVGCTPYGDEDVAAFDPLLAGCRTRQDRDVLSRSTVDTERLSAEETFDAFGEQDFPHLTGNVGILTAEKLRPILDDRHPTAEATIRLTEFETNVASTEHDQVWRNVVDFQRFNAGERAGSLQAGNVGNR